MRVVDVGASDFAFEVPESVEGGLVRVRLENSGEEPHHAQLVKLNEGVSFEAFQGLLAENLPTGNLGPIFGAVTFEGGPASVPAGGSSEAVLDLQGGSYALLCFVEGADGVPHLAKGMVKGFEVTAAAEDQPEEPETDVTISLRDFSFSGVPSSIEAGTVTWEVVNEGQEPHEMAVLELDGVTGAEFTAGLGAMLSGEAPAGPPPFVDAGGFQAVMPGDGGWAELELESGKEYALICFVPSPANQGAPHAALGMVTTFAVE